MLGIHPYGEGFYGDPGFFYFTVGGLSVSGSASITLGEATVTKLVGALSVAAAPTITLGDIVVTTPAHGDVTVGHLYVLGDQVTVTLADSFAGALAGHPFGADTDYADDAFVYGDGYITLGDLRVTPYQPPPENDEPEPHTFWIDVTDEWKDPIRPRGLKTRHGW